MSWDEDKPCVREDWSFDADSAGVSVANTEEAVYGNWSEDCGLAKIRERGGRETSGRNPTVRKGGGYIYRRG